MKMLITGGTGFVGGHLTRRLLDDGHWVVAIGTRPDHPYGHHNNLTYLQTDTSRPGDWQDMVPSADVIINLAGKTIFHRWSRKYKKMLYDSRILTTRNLVQAMINANHQTLISASAVGYYGDGKEAILTEESPRGNDFLADLAGAWETTAKTAAANGARVVLPRFGIVLGKEAGALPTLLKASRSFVGGPVGTGRQWVSWIHIQDLVAALVHLAVGSDLTGPVNLCAPDAVRNKEMAALIGEIIGRPAKVPVPAMALKMMMGELADVLLASQRGAAERLVATGFEFHYPQPRAALVDLLD